MAHLITQAASLRERRAQGKALRAQVPRQSHAAFVPAADRPDVVSMTTQQDEGKIASLLPLKYGRMLASPFAYFRGSAAAMAFDLRSTPQTGVRVQLCGDAHLSNFGVFASPERNLVFDINDFDETLPGSWEWDVKRLTASIVVAGRDRTFSDSRCRDAAKEAVTAYRTAVQRASESNYLDVWYFHINEGMIKAFSDHNESAHRQHIESVMRSARSRTHGRSLARMTEVVDGERRFRSDPPLLVPLRDAADQDSLTRQIASAWAAYRRSLRDERRQLLDRFSLIDVALRVGGVGSVGTRCFVALLQGRDIDDCIVLQQKQTGPSCLAPYFPKHAFSSEALRVINGQRAIQATPDIFLGWHRADTADDDCYYWRQLADMKGSADISDMNFAAFAAYGQLCGFCLGRAHARTGDPAIISAYIGKGDALAEALAAFAVAYADQVEKDYEVMRRAVRDGQIVAEVPTVD